MPTKHASKRIMPTPTLPIKHTSKKTFTHLAVFGLCGDSNEKNKTQDLHGALRIEIEISTESIKGDNWLLNNFAVPSAISSALVAKQRQGCFT